MSADLKNKNKKIVYIYKNDLQYNSHHKRARARHSDMREYIECSIAPSTIKMLCMYIPQSSVCAQYICTAPISALQPPQFDLARARKLTRLHIYISHLSLSL